MLVSHPSRPTAAGVVTLREPALIARWRSRAASLIAPPSASRSLLRRSTSDWTAATAFAPRKAATTIYLPDGVGAYPQALERLGPHTTGVGCLYLKDLAAVDLAVLEGMVTESFRTVTEGTFTQRASDHR